MKTSASICTLKRTLTIALLLILITQSALGITPVFTCGFECGVSGAHWTLSATSSFSTSTVRSGVRSLRANADGTTPSTAVAVAQGSATRWIGRFYIWFSALPSANVALASTLNSSTGPLVFFKQSDSKIYASIGGTTGATGVSVTTGQWYCVDFDFNIQTAGSDFCDVQVDGVACGQATATGLSAAQSAFTLGNAGVSTATMDVFYDDLVLSNTSADYPIGPGKVLSFVPDADGTHTATTTTIVKGTAAAPTGGGNVAGSTDVFNWLNARPIGGGATGATRLVNQQTTGATLYAEVDFEPTTEVNPPRAVEVLVVDQQASTAVGDMHIKVNDNGTESVVLDRTNVAGVITDRYTTKQYATMVGGGDWTLIRFNALKIRFGYSGDANPDQYFRGTMIEAEFASSPARVPRLTTQRAGEQSMLHRH